MWHLQDAGSLAAPLAASGSPLHINAQSLSRPQHSRCPAQHNINKLSCIGQHKVYMSRTSFQQQPCTQQQQDSSSNKITPDAPLVRANLQIMLVQAQQRCQGCTMLLTSGRYTRIASVLKRLTGSYINRGLFQRYSCNCGRLLLLFKTGSISSN